MKRVLIIDDDRFISDMLSEMLSDEKFEVKILSDSDNIVADVKDFNPDIILLDYILPRRNGGELCHEVKANTSTSEIPVIMLSAYPKVLKSLGNYGADSFVEKPFDLWCLLDLIKGYCKTGSCEKETIIRTAYRPES
ncbi:response regulator [Desertivirga arenae]|uniref:response regulator n=1 Tax=Desertivirga arenae TaxID=2810309 RepID=UPI001A973750|nr:response regulator [Pedobacter sp. SYSU D00823]